MYGDQMKSLVTAVSAIAMLVAAPSAFAQTITNEELLERLERLEQQNAE